jgi:hypothetical protein
MYKIQLQENQDEVSNFQQENEARANDLPDENNENQIDEMPHLRQNQDLMSKKTKKTFFIICGIAILAGTLTGFGAFKLKNQNGTANQNMENVTVGDSNKVKNGDIFGVQDKETFADNATGYLEKGGVDGEGSHRLLREGGDSQTVALTSSVVDLDKLVGFEVKLYGETHKAEKAGWFMDVGRVEVINTEAEAPIQTLE